jgi:hypothetical protein
MHENVSFLFHRQTYLDVMIVLIFSISIFSHAHNYTQNSILYPQKIEYNFSRPSNQSQNFFEHWSTCVQPFTSAGQH